MEFPLLWSGLISIIHGLGEIANELIAVASGVCICFGRISGYIISSKPRCLVARNFALILILIPFTAHEKTNFAESADRSFTNGFSGPKRLRDLPGLPRGSIAC